MNIGERQESSQSHGQAVRYEGRLFSNYHAERHGFKLDTQFDTIVFGVRGLDQEDQLACYIPVRLSNLELEVAQSGKAGFKKISTEAVELVDRK